MQKIINFRPFLNIFFVGSMGILFAYAFFINNIAIIFLIGLMLLLLLIKLAFYHKITFFQVSKKRSFVVLLLIVFLCSFFYFKLRVEAFETQQLEGNYYVVEARIGDRIEEDDSSYTLYLEEATLIEGEHVINLKKNIKLYLIMDEVLDDSNFKVGNRILFTTNVYDYKIIKNGQFNTYYYLNNIGHHANVNISNVTFYSGAMRFDETVRLETKQLLAANLSYNNANLSYATLFGDKSFLEATFYEEFINSGIAHLLAVSGLHIGFLVVILLFLFSILKIPNKIQLFLLFLFLLFYSYLCGFSPSIIRASIMALVFLFGHLIGERNDALSNLMFAGIIILLINPVYLLTAGFLLSFASVFGILLLYPIFTKWLYQIKVPEKLVQMIAITLSAQLAILPIILYFFKEVSLLSIVTNLFVLPIFTVGYFTLFFAVIFTSILSFFSFLFLVPSLLFTFVHIVAKLVSSVPFNVVYLFLVPLSAIISYYFILLVCSQFVLLPKKQKTTLILVAFFILVTSILTSFIPKSFSYESIIKIDGVASANIVTTQQNLTYLIDVGDSSNTDEYYINSFLKSNKINQLEAIILPDYNEEKQTILCNLVKMYKVESVYIPMSTNNNLIFSLIYKLPVTTQVVFMEHEQIYTHENVQITSYSNNEEGYLLKLHTTNMQALFADTNLNTQELIFISSQITPITKALIMDRLTNYSYNILSQNAYFNDIEHILVSKNQITQFQQNLYDTITYGHLQVK